MKKRLFLLFAMLPLLGAITTSCSDKEKEDTSWTEIPKKVEGTSAVFTVNGATSTGSVEFTPQSATDAAIKLNNVINGYDLVEMPVKMEKQGDGSFNFVGEQGMTVAPVKSTTPVIVNISATGNVTLDGKATVQITTSGAGLAVGTYKNTTLVLKYSDVTLTGKTVVLDALSVDDVAIKLTDVFPGEKESVLSGLKLTNGVISGTATTEGKTTATCDGTLKENVLTLNLKDVKVNDPNRWAGTYGLSDYQTGTFTYLETTEMQNWVTSGALYLNWKFTDPTFSYSDIWGGLFRFAGSAVLPQVLKSVKLEADGNVCADFLNKPNITFDPNWMMSVFFGTFPAKEDIIPLFPSSGWEGSPKNLAYWFEKNGQLYVKLNIPAILAKEMGAGGAEIGAVIESVLNSSPAEVKGLVAGLGFNIDKIQDETIATLLSYAKDGFPLVVKEEAGHHYLYLDKPLFDLLMKTRPSGEVDDAGEPIMMSDIMTLWTMLSEAGIVPEEAAAIGALLPSIVGDYQGATEFGLGLDLKKQ